MSDLAPALRLALHAHADATRAASAQAYMKSAMPYYGLDAPTLRAICKTVFLAHPLPTFAAWTRVATGLWKGARFREERYAVIELTGHRMYRAHQTLEALPMYERFIIEGAWWDYVDVLAIRRIGPLLSAYPREMKRTLLAWSRGDDLWKRRSAIIAQVGFKETTDPDLLARFIQPSLGRKEFWLRKAIGWALRAYAWREPDWVVRYVKEHAGELSPLSVREALKNVGT